MRVDYKDNQLERILISVNALTSALVAASFIMLYGGFERSLLPYSFLYVAQVFLLCIFIAEKIFRLFNSTSKLLYLRVNWFEIPLLLFLIIIIIGAGHWFA